MEYREDYVLGKRSSSLKALGVALVYVYYAGTTTLANIYSDKNGTAKANPITCDSTGKYWYYGGGYYKETASYDGYDAGTKDNIFLELSTRTITADDTLDPLTDGGIFANCASGNITLMLPPLSEVMENADPIWVQMIGSDTNILTLTPDGAETINGEATRTLEVRNEKVGLVKQSATNWQTI